LVRMDTAGNQLTYDLFTAASSNFISSLATDSSGAVYADTRGIGAQILKLTFN
jgi:hypothetical protein